MTSPDVQQAPCMSQTHHTYSESNIFGSVKILSKILEIMSAENGANALSDASCVEIAPFWMWIFKLLYFFTSRIFSFDEWFFPTSQTRFAL